MDQKHIRNFSIIAHVDHGKSTLADRFIQTCGGLTEREMDEQVLDSMELERERGITIKAQSVTLDYQARNGETYKLNFIDTPGHVDFSYEVSRSLAACEGALLVVDAAQGVEAQSVANCYTAVELGLDVIPVLNKIDLPSAEPERVKQEIEDIIGIEARDALCISAKTGQGIEEVLESLVHGIPCPRGNPDAPFKALIIDSWFDNYLGIVSLIRVVDGSIAKGEKIRLMSTGQTTPGRAGRRIHAEARCAAPDSRRRGRLFRGRHQGCARRAGRRHGDAGQGRCNKPFARIQKDAAARVRRAVSNRCRQLSGSARSAGSPATQRRVAAIRAGNLRSAGVSASAAVSSVCCTWISSRSGWSANTTWTW